MSLGWQCESALLPSKAKPINIDSKSMMKLKAAVFNEEMKLSLKDKDKSNRIRANRGLHNNSNDHKDIFKRKNIGVDKRDEASQKNNKNLNKESKVISSLKAKSELYQCIAEGKLGAGDFLVDFDSKGSSVGLGAAISAPATAAVLETKSNVDELVDIEDIYGRNKRVKRDSNEYKDYLSRQKITSADTNSIYYDYGHSTEKWQWSNGQPDDDMYSDTYTNNKKIHDILQSKIDNEVIHSNNISSDARVRSQWEKIIKDDKIKSYLNEIHETTSQIRHNNSICHNNSNNIDDDNVVKNNSNSVVINENYERNHKKELLLQKQLNRKKQKLDVDNMASNEQTGI
jgi:hypothetical protein